MSPTNNIFHQEEVWVDIPGYPRYQISTEGRVFNNETGHIMRTSINNYGQAKISLLTEYGQRDTKSVAYLVAKVFVERPNALCDRIIYLDGNQDNARAENLAWRPRWFRWKYTHQMRINQPVYYHNLPVVNLETNVEYDNIIQAGITEGLLFDAIWRSTHSGDPVFPTGSEWQVVHRV